MLAQLLIQFQKPIILQQPNELMQPPVVASFRQANDSNVNDFQATLDLNRTRRSYENYNVDATIEEFAQKLSVAGHRIRRNNDATISTNANDLSDDVKVVKKPKFTFVSDRDDEFASPDKSTLDEIGAWFQHIWNDINWLGSMVIAMCTLSFLFVHHSDLRQRMVGARMRIACCSLIYRKTLRLSKKSAGRTAAGYLVNLLSNDVSRLDYGFIYAHYVWILPIQSCLVAYLIWRQVGWAALVGVVGLLLKTIPVQTGLSRWSSILRMKVATRTDQRVGIMNEIVQGIQVIKMYAWEKPFQVVVAEARRREVKQIRYASFIRGINMR